MKKINKYQYLQCGKSIFRYTYYDKYKAYGPIGEYYSVIYHKWIISMSSVDCRMDGDGTIISEKRARKLIKKLEKECSKQN